MPTPHATRGLEPWPSAARRRQGRDQHGRLREARQSRGYGRLRNPSRSAAARHRRRAHLRAQRPGVAGDPHHVQRRLRARSQSAERGRRAQPAREDRIRLPHHPAHRAHPGRQRTQGRPVDRPGTGSTNTPRLRARRELLDALRAASPIQIDGPSKSSPRVSKPHHEAAASRRGS